MNRKLNRSLLVVSLLIVASMILGACTPAATPTAAPQPTKPAVQATAVPANKALVGIVLPTKDEPRWLQDQAAFQKAGWEPLFSQGQRQGKGQRRSADQPGREGDHHHPARRDRGGGDRRRSEGGGRQDHFV